MIGQIQRAIDVTGTIVYGIADDQWHLPTPCAEWDVRTLLNHTVGGMQIFAAELDGRAHGDHEDDWLAADPAGAYRAAAAADLAAWQRPGALDGKVQISLGVLPGPMAAVIHLTELVVHGADLAVATGQEHLVDEDACDALLGTMRTMGMDAYRLPGVFNAELQPEPDAPAHRRLLAFLGRG
ncbi:TIGR03086 family metal-binding protein [Nonomuraea sp. NPDC050556]|uniref:TIGR03086 family metal-binding protein n=1 Tax=Nonomuraea sp. NPDC050556 TaxID=3364369 RepID=UPI00379F3767